MKKSKKSKSLLILILFGCLNQVLVNSQTIQPIERSIGKLHISIDPRMELLTTVQLLSKYPMIIRALPYSKELLDYFESMSSHAAVLMTDTLEQKNGFSYDAPPSFMLHLSQLHALETKFALTQELILRSGGGDNLEQYRKLLKHFAEISNFETFWNSKIPFYNQILDLTVADIGEMDLVKDLENYFNESHQGYSITISPSFIGGYGHNITDADGNVTIYGCVTTTNLKDNVPYLGGTSLRDLIWHEFGHSFANVTDKNFERAASLNKLFEPIKEVMARQAYRTWRTCLNEHVVRAVNVRLFDLHLGSQQSKELLNRELGQHYIYIEPLIEKLKEFETQRDKYNVTFSEFYPELLNMLDSLQKIEYWKQFNMNFNGPITGTFPERQLAIIYPTCDLDTASLKIAQNQASLIFDFINQQRENLTLIADTTALKTDISEYGIMAFGTIESNLFLKRYASTFPFRIENQMIYAEKEYTDKDIKFITCVPNPLNPEKGMSIFTALSNKALQGMSDIFYKDVFQILSYDYVLFLNSDTVISSGFYKKAEEWRF